MLVKAKLLKLLIVPSGIETGCLARKRAQWLRLLIVPSGIETHKSLVRWLRYLTF